MRNSAALQQVPGDGPVLLNAAISQTMPNIVTLAISESVEVDAADFFTETDSADALNVTVIINGNGTGGPQLALDRQVLPGESVTLTYSGDAITGFINEPVENNVHIDYINDFTGNLNDSLRGEIVNPNAAALIINYNSGSIISRRVTDANVTTFVNYFRAKRRNASYTFPKGRVYMAYLNKFLRYTASVWSLRIYVDANNYARFYNGGSGQLWIEIRTSGTQRYLFNTGLTLGDYFVKIKHDTNDDFSFYYWDGAVWVLLDPTHSPQNWNIGSAMELRYESLSDAADAINDVFAVQVMRVTDQDFSTLVPEYTFL